MEPKIFILVEEEKWQKVETDIKMKFLRKKKKHKKQNQAKCMCLSSW